VSVIPTPHTVSLGLFSHSHSSGEDPDVPQKVGNPRQMHQNQDQDQEASQSPSQPLSSPIPLTKQRTRNAPFVPVPYRPRSEYVLWLLPFFLFRHVFKRGWMSRPSPGARDPVLTAPSDTCRMHAASHERDLRAGTDACGGRYELR
jgi:hypothetical protein